MISFSRLAVVVACVVGIQPAFAYDVNEQDQEVLLALGEVPTTGMGYVRCEKQHCYFIANGEYAGSQPTDGIYLVWLDMEPPQTSE
jgi:hypothetical protein